MATRAGCRTEPEASQCQLQQLQAQLPQADLPLAREPKTPDPSQAKIEHFVICLLGTS